VLANQRLPARRLTGLAGLTVVALFGIGSALWVFDQPDAGAPAHQIVVFYASSSTRIIAGASLSLVAVALFVAFGSGVRTILQEREEDGLLATTAFGGALLVVAAGLGAETINMAAALRAAHGQLTPQLAQALFEISYALGYNAAGVGIGTLLLAVAAAALRTQAIMPRWLALVLLAAGAVFVTPLSRFLLGPALLLLAAVSVRLLTAPAPLEA
jgi:hypothetical protein